MQIIDPVDAILKHKGNEVWTIPPDATVYEAIKKMANKNIGSLVVMEGERLAGLISERDYTRKVMLKGKSSRDTAVQEIMVRDVLTVTPQHTVEECMRIMTENRVRHLPVVEGAKVVGIVSIGNLVNWIITAQTSTISQLQNYITGQYPG